MLVYVFVYVAILLAIGVADSFRVKNFEDYAVAGRKQSQTYVVLSLMATMIGASATIGIMNRVNGIGFPAFWWLAVGSIGLLLQGIFISEKVRALEANTLPDMVNKTVGKSGAYIVSLIIIIAWPGIVASQILAMTSILASITGKSNNKTLMLIVAIVVILYTTIGGQLSVIKTDALQFTIIAVAFIATFIYLFFFGHGDNNIVLSNVELLNDRYTIKDLVIQLFIVGGTYLLGPDVMSRNLVSKDGKTAKRSAFIAAAILLVFSVVIVLIGLWITLNEGKLGSENPLIYIIDHELPKPIGVLLAIGLLSTLLSSADTCLVNISSIIEMDILKRNKVWETRLWAVIVGAIAVFIAFDSGDIIAKLTGAYSIYAPGIVCPLFVAILAHKKRKLCIPVWLLAVIGGGLCGAISTYGGYISKDITANTFVANYLPITGMGISLVLAVLSVVLGNKMDEKGSKTIDC